jgi:hypothetical protein
VAGAAAQAEMGFAARDEMEAADQALTRAAAEAVQLRAVSEAVV